MKKLMLLLIVLNVGRTYSQDTTYYDLDWKIDKGARIIYSTAFEQISSTSNIDFDSFFGSFADTLDSDKGEFVDFFNSLKDQFKSFSLITTLSREEDDIIDVVVFFKPNNPEKKPKDSKTEFFTKALSGIQLRGKLNLDGGIESFYMKNDQKNLLSILFELPTKRVKVGDKWPLQVNLLSVDQNFVCNEYKNRNSVELIDVRNIDGKDIAILRYDLYSFVKGDFQNPLTEKAIPSSMEMQFNGLCEFNITDGKWKDFNGLMSTVYSGIMNSNVKQSLILVEIENQPAVEKN
jgi:hypothetical protein